MAPRAAILASLAVLTVAACGGPAGSDSKDATLDGLDDLEPASVTLVATSDIAVPGRCLGGQTMSDEPGRLRAAIAMYGMAAYRQLSAAPDWADVVGCDKPHRFEIYAAVRLPDRLDSRVGSYADLLDSSTPLAAAVDDAVFHQCALAIPAAARVMNRGRTIAQLDVDVEPAVDRSLGTLTWSAVPPDAWNSGDHSFGCLFMQPRDTTTRVAALTDATLPDDGRICLSGAMFVSCADAHDTERLTVLRLDRAVAAGRLPGARAVTEDGLVNLGSAQWAALDHVCQAYLTAIAGHRLVGLRGVANTYPDFYPDAAGHYTVVCSARSSFATPARDLRVTTDSVYDAR